MNVLPRFVLGKIENGSDDDVTVCDRLHGGCVVAKFRVRGIMRGGQEKAIERARAWCSKLEREALEAGEIAAKR
jgi:hypothetical protein